MKRLLPSTGRVGWGASPSPCWWNEWFSSALVGHKPRNLEHAPSNCVEEGWVGPWDKQMKCQ